MTKKKFIGKKICKMILPLFMIAALTACGNTVTEEKGDTSTESSTDNSTDNSTESDTVTGYVTPTVENGEIVIDTEALTEKPLYINYDSNGTNIQMIAVKASDGSARLSLNTCQACNPSPKAYFVKEDGKLVCQNCGNVFTMDSVGEASGGCNPMNIDYEVIDTKLTVKTADLDNYADKFTSWGGPVE